MQRVSRASVSTGDERLGTIGAGMLILVCAMRGDTARRAELLAQRIAHFRFFPDEHGRMNRSALECRLPALVVSQFTLAHDSSSKSGRRPSFDAAAPPGEAIVLCEAFVAALRALGLETAEGRFGARMQVELVNDGPVTFWFDEP